MASLTPLSPDKIVEACFSSVDEVKVLLLYAYRELEQTTGEIYRPLAQEKVKIYEKILDKLENK